MKRLLLSIGIAAATALGGQAAAQPVESEGEASRVQSCFYECKPGPVVQGIPTWQEITTLMLVNPSVTTTVSGVPGLMIVDGNGNIIAGADYSVSPRDLDEVNVCRTLEAAGIPAPQAGVILVANNRVPYVWVKNLLGKFFTNVDEPFDGRVTGVAKTECRVVPPSVLDVGGLSDDFDASGAPRIDPILVEGTDDF